MSTLKHTSYRPRLIDSYIDVLLNVFGAVQIDGPKFCGKTWTARAHAKSEIRLDRKESKELAIADASVVLKGDTPRLIDEWSEVPSIRDDIRRTVDEAGNEPGQFLLTGSSVPPRDSYTHSGAGRIARIHMRPLSLYEMGFSDGRISLRDLLQGKQPEAFSAETGLDVLATCVCNGGWPVSLGRPGGSGILIARQYLKSVFEDSAPRMNKTPSMARRAFAALARNNGTPVTLNTLASDMALGEHADSLVKPAQTTVESYLDFYRDIYLLEELPGWDAPLRSRKRLRTKPKRYVVDPSLALSMLGANESSLLNDLQMFGIMFENMCLRDLRVYTSIGAEYEGAELRYYRDDFGLEIDVIIQLADGRWGAFEIKLSEDKVEEGVKQLVKLRNIVAENAALQNHPPSFLAVLVGRSSFARTTPEGIHVIPITSLKA